jgi:single-stranded-DNA-specific exonuclease
VILTESNNKITGSARSVNGFDLYEAIYQCADLLEKFGGHKYAAGLTLDMANLPAFQQRFEEVVSASITEEMLTPMVEIDVPVSLDAITSKFMNVLKQMAPFGPENQRPVFAANNLYVSNSLSNFKERHIRFIVGQQGNERTFQAIAFDQAQHYARLAAGDSFTMAFTVEENTFNGNTSIQLKVKDIKFE